MISTIPSTAALLAELEKRFELLKTWPDECADFPEILSAHTQFQELASRLPKEFLGNRPDPIKLAPPDKPVRVWTKKDEKELEIPRELLTDALKATIKRATQDEAYFSGFQKCLDMLRYKSIPENIAVDILADGLAEARHSLKR